MARRPFKADVWLPGHNEQGRGIIVTKVSAGSEEGLDRALTRWLDQGYVVRRYEDLELDLEVD